MFGFFRRRRTPQLEAQWLVVGLGNPGAKYTATRHNVGYMAVDELAGELAPVPGIKALVQVRDGVAYARSTTYMNTTGEAVGPLAKELGVTPERIIVVHDELDLPAGKVRVKLGGNENGHNGLKSITEHLGTRDYLRVRMGIGRPPQGMAVPDWVLSPIDGDISGQVALAAKAVQLIVSEGLAKAQNVIHATR
ncbi:MULTISPECIES: aminoacyl-tRNA hydrolase [Corynebacterium]|uniref:Peptidyl-tRNA hydrolase n=2 Tax=Corynebacterium TaxID=1716 RepID=A0A7W2E8W1_9CORY|nr:MULTISPECIES: aminoacyl-tRNA hydrolase [Corynebacterium]MBA5243296.1 aminoacyl-tRNA hydrolase [Corynebacterium haemomassiliense]MCZ9292154.1 aminoacyl-tRNA hydrolase [Corynebacterium lehmanniae]